MEDFICVTIDGVEILELDCEDDGSYRLCALSSLTGCEALGLRYKNESTGNYRGVKAGELLQPREGWGSRVYTVVTRNVVASGQSLDMHSSLDEPIKSSPSAHGTSSGGAELKNNGIKSIKV